MRFRDTILCGLAVAGLWLVLPAPSVKAETVIEGPRKSDDGIITYTVTSEYLAGPNAVEIILPDKLDSGKRYPVLYILPVNAGTRGQWGSGIQEARRLDVANKYGLICAAPAFDSLPWYADHPTNPKIRQESHFLKVVLPLVEERTPAMREPRGRLLIGFSKSGWGAFSLLLRHPELFSRAAAWDSPLMMQTPTKFGMGDIFGTQANFEPYKISALLGERAGLLKGGPARLILLGYGNFKEDTEQAHARMAALGIPHVYDNSTQRKHEWHSGWFAEAVKHLVSGEAAAPEAKTP